MNHPIKEYRQIAKTVLKTLDRYRYTNLAGEVILFRKDKVEWLRMFR